MGVRSLAFSVALLAAASAADVSTQRQGDDVLDQEGAAASSGEHQSSERPVEELTVVGERVPLSASERRQIYRELARGKRLFARDKIDKALPYLISGARQGFKDSQARVGHIYLQGLGDVPRDSEQAIGWLGVAADGQTSPGIRNYFNDIWKRIPERYVPYFEEVVLEYRTKYGRHATGVVCEMKRPLHSHVKQLGCFFEEDLHDDVRESLDEREARAEAVRLLEERRQEAITVMDELRRSGIVQ